jgi:hypothetical protein
VKFALAELRSIDVVTQLLGSSEPPRATGTTWSMVAASSQNAIWQVSMRQLSWNGNASGRRLEISRSAAG